MAPIKFDDNIKNKLEKRTIEPSDNAWNKLSDKLDTQENQSNKKIIWWLGIAASLVGVFLVSTLFFNKNEEDLLPTLVENPIEEVLINKKEPQNNNLVVENELAPQIEDHIIQGKVNTDLVKQEVFRKTVTKRKEIYTSSSEAIANNVREDSAVKNEDLIHSNAIINEENKQEIVVQVINLDKELVTDQEIESLLERAQKEIALNRFNEESPKVVDANSLLQNVETDLELSFRDKMFNTIIYSYEAVKTAVVERND